MHIIVGYGALRELYKFIKVVAVLLEERKHHRKLSRSPRNYYNQEPLSMNSLDNESIDAFDWMLLTQMF